MRDRSALVAAALLAALAAQCLASMRLKSATFDEPSYLASGYTVLTTGVDLNPAHPPLMKLLFAVPMALVGSSPSAAIPNWDGALQKPRTYGASFVFENRVDADTLLFAGRSAVVLVSLLLAGLVWTWARQLYGPVAAAVALGLYAFDPNLIAHSTVATLDLGVTAGVAVASYAFWRACKRPTPLAGAAAGAALATAVLIKSTALLLLLLVPLEVAAAVVWHRRRLADPSARSGKRRAAKIAPPSATRALVMTTGITLAVALAVVAAVYGVGPYLVGLGHGLLDRAKFMAQSYEAFCWGRYSATGFWWYFLAAFVLKTPVPTLVAAAATSVWLVRRGTARLFDELFLVLPIAAFLVATMFVRDDLGLRYILPVYPLLYVLIGGTTAAVWQWARERLGSQPWRARAAAATVGALAFVQIGGTLAIYPDYLAFFNGLFCLPRDGIRYLDDSNIDWGQDYKQLVADLRERGITEVAGLYYPFHLAPYVAKHYGLALRQPSFDEVRQPEPGWYAVSAHLLQRPSLTTDPANRDLRFDWLDRYTPVARVGYSIYVYHFDE